MKKQEIINLFPITANITQEIIDKAYLGDIRKCIGALTLKTVIPENDVIWGVESGGIYPNEVGEQAVKITTVEKTNMTDVTKPQEVTFIMVE